MQDIKMSPPAKFRANACKSKRVSDNWNLRWRPPPSWICYYFQFWSHALFSAVISYNRATFD